MNIKKNIFFVDEIALIEALRLYGKGPKTKDYEYVISIFIKRIFEKKYQKPFTIVFETNNKQHDFKRNFNPTPEETNSILRNLLEQDTPVDFGLVEGNPGNFSGPAYPFQLKRYIGEYDQQFTLNLANFINKKANEYRDDKVSLIVIPEISANEKNNTQKMIINIEELTEKIKIEKNALRSIMILEYSKKEPKLTQIWPVYGVY